MRGTQRRGLRMLLLIVACAVMGPVAGPPAHGLGSPHVIVGAGYDVNTETSFVVAVLPDLHGGISGHAAVNGDRFAVECIVVDDRTTHHRAYFGGRGAGGYYYITVHTGYLPPLFRIKTLLEGEGDACNPGAGPSLAEGRGFFFVGPEVPDVPHAETLAAHRFVSREAFADERFWMLETIREFDARAIRTISRLPRST